VPGVFCPSEEKFEASRGGKKEKSVEDDGSTGKIGEGERDGQRPAPLKRAKKDQARK